jgi:hypothetical protein
MFGLLLGHGAGLVRSILAQWKFRIRFVVLLFSGCVWVRFFVKREFWFVWYVLVGWAVWVLLVGHGWRYGWMVVPPVLFFLIFIPIYWSLYASRSHCGG